MKTYMCWRCCQFIDKEKVVSRIPQDKLLVRKESSTHIDYCCPICEAVIICYHKGRDKTEGRFDQRRM
jgi:phage FluMu protein Com